MRSASSSRRGGGVQLGGRLVGEQQARTGWRARSPGRAAGSRGRPAAAGRCESRSPSPSRSRRCLAARRPAARRARHRGGLDVLPRGEVRREVCPRVLQHVPGHLAPVALLLRAAQPGEVVAAHADRPGARPLQASKDVHQRRLAAAAATGDRHHLPRLHLQVEPLQRHHLEVRRLVDVNEPFALDDRRGHASDRTVVMTSTLEPMPGDDAVPSPAPPHRCRPPRRAASVGRRGTPMAA